MATQLTLNGNRQVNAAQPGSDEAAQLRLENQQLHTQVQGLNRQLANTDARVQALVEKRIAAAVQGSNQDVERTAAVLHKYDQQGERITRADR